MDETEQKILDAAMKVFASEGYKGATTRRIAQEANVAELTLFRKFQSKDNLLKEVLIKKREPVLSVLDSLFRMEEEADLTTSLHNLGKNIAKTMKDRMKEREYLMFMFMLIEEGRRRPEVAEIFSSIFQMNIARLSEYFELQIKNGKMRNVNPRSAALVFVSYFVHTSLLKGVLSDDVLGDSEKEFEEFIDIFTNGIVKSRTRR
ncbi:MAG: TetR/AcrR family transcriptional regulator [Candidatus Methanoperedens sp.]|nr:TetR/AcrR family transcriptional regulator [Candidatus Methanoperedens sp.]MCZ7396485.1 TetR/AcrR family transcriptional regulator [Candidatus Methanoperedens sp.]